MHYLNKILFSTLLALLSLPVDAQLIKDFTTVQHMNASLAKQKKLASGRFHQLFDIFNRPMRPAERQALEYLFAYLPLSDLADYTGEFFLEQVKTTSIARNDMPWGPIIPEEVFLHFVLPIRVNNENLDNFRVQMYDELKERIRELNMHDAAIEINHWCHQKVSYRGTDDRTSSPLATIKTSFGRCGEESTLTVAALRTVGIPARQVYTPRWAHCDDNHAWVEVWVDGDWHFMGACEPEPELNMGWFSAVAKRAMLIHTRTFGYYNGSEPVIEEQEKFSEINLTGRYASTKAMFAKVLDSYGKPVKGAKVEYKLYNYAEFYPIASGLTDSSGISSLITGLGDLLVWATYNGDWDYQKVNTLTTDTIVLYPNKGREPGFSEFFDLIPPVEKTAPDNNISITSREMNSKSSLLEDSIRLAYMLTFKDSTRATSFAKKLNINTELCISLFSRSNGNWQEIAAFIESVTKDELPWALSLLESISDKDLCDTHSEILLDHLRNSLPYPSELRDLDNNFFTSYVMSGRISNEMMLPWRGYLKQQFSAEFESDVHRDIQVLVSWIINNIRVDSTSNLHSRAPLSPRGVYELRITDFHSRDIFFVAICRCFGIPARINPASGLPQIWKNTDWQNIIFEPINKNSSEKGVIHFINTNPGCEPKYAVNFSLALYRDGVYRTIELEYGKSLHEIGENLELETGQYYLVTGNRQSDGSVLATLSFFTVSSGKTSEIELSIRDSSIRKESLGKLNMMSLILTTYSSLKKLPISVVIQPKGAVFIWLDPATEPSRHIITDIAAIKTILEKWKGGIVIILPSEKTDISFEPDLYKDFPVQHTFAFETNSGLTKEISRLRGHHIQNKLPVIVLCDSKGNLLYFSEGYKIGVGEQLAKEINRLD